MGDYVIETAFIDCCPLPRKRRISHSLSMDDHVKLTGQKLTVQCNISSSVKACERIEEVSELKHYLAQREKSNIKRFQFLAIVVNSVTLGLIACSFGKLQAFNMFNLFQSLFYILTLLNLQNITK